MLSKYELIIIMEGEFCKFIIYKICVSIQSSIFMKLNKNQPVIWTDSEAFTIFKCFSISNNMLADNIECIS